MKLCIFSGLILTALCAAAAEFHVSPGGDDANAGTRDKPFATPARAQQAARAAAGKEPVTVWLRGGTYALPSPLVFTPADSGTPDAPVVWQAFPGESPVISGGLKLDLEWEPHRNGILKARVPAGLTSDQLFVNGRRQLMARYPNYDASVRPYGGYAADAFGAERAARWADPAGGYIHAMHSAHWGGYHYRITGRNEKGEIIYEGGWQNNRQMGMHAQHRYVENIFEEPDAPGEWFHNPKTGTLYFYPPAGMDWDGSVEVVRLRHLIEFQGAPPAPVRHLTLRGFIFRHAARTFMETKEPLLRSDWTIYRGGAVLFNGAEDCTVADCEFDQLGGNAVFVNNRNRRVTIRGCDLHDTGATAVAFVGDPQAVRNPLFEYNQRQRFADIDTAPGPKTDNYPADCLVEDCLIRGMGVVEKQATGIQISMSMGITVRHCSIYEASRAGINISEGTFGGHVIEFCDVFDTVRETGDHGSFNSWGRDRYWGLTDVPPGELPKLARLDAVMPTILRNNRWRCDHGWDVDLDDGSSNYEISNNLFLNGGLKLREGFHRRVWNNIAVNNSFHPHAWYEHSGDVVTNNIWMGAYRPAAMSDSLERWGQDIDRNLFTTSEADRLRFAQKGCDEHSLVGDPLFVDPARGDFRVKDGSPALRLGFRNFAMDRFGVMKPALRAIARTPEMPKLATPGPTADTARAANRAKPPWFWLEARIRDLEGEEYSAFGVSRESGGVHLPEVPPASAAARCGLQSGDLVRSVNGRPARTVRDLLRLRDAGEGKGLIVGFVRGQQLKQTTIESQPYAIPESASAETEFRTVRLANAGVAPVRAVTTRPDTVNEPVATLHDGRLAADYGPVFGNGIRLGLYKADLGTVREISSVATWSFDQNDNRGSQRFTLFGSAAPEDPGWDVADPQKFTPIASVDSRCEGRFHGTRLQGGADCRLGSFRWLVWAVSPVTELGENTAYQEFQVR